MVFVRGGFLIEWGIDGGLFINLTIGASKYEKRGRGIEPK